MNQYRLPFIAKLYSTESVRLVLFIHSSVECLACFHVGAIMDTAAMSIHV